MESHVPRGSFALRGPTAALLPTRSQQRPHLPLTESSRNYSSTASLS
jgi:hypothetical protein